ncbi:hypothetical protein H257_18162 [Aphanomyces astaci]|uniref:Uncharacterized protein n=1 Tax=Aphanomyces astaci TaxID=112090 RepID=W4FE81_APHAT|nr:hypothetical protein H257_18162 [Aphanomyces astaci]ETV65038.1 hypothetical protein H257_18162 [Aphanomyces astaci]|eukprot:XP_009845474.1 hypothetical protein H257_18162 [Aphanomyces astaci]
MAKNSKNYTQKPKGATKAPAAAGSEAEEEVGGVTTDALSAVEESKSEEVRKTIEELTKAEDMAVKPWDRTGNSYHDPRSEAPILTNNIRRQRIPTAKELSPMPRSERTKRQKSEPSYVLNDDIDRTLSGDGSTRPIVLQRKSVSTTPNWGARLMIVGCWTRPYQAAQDGDLFRADHRRQAAEDEGPNIPGELGEEAGNVLDKLRVNAQRMGGEWRRSAVRWIPSTDRSLLKATCTYVWRVPVEQFSEDDYRDRIMEIVGQPGLKTTPTKSDMQTYCRALSVDPHGDVGSRLVSLWSSG